MKVQGRCHCGEITYEAEVAPGTVNVCHCRDCQMLSGTAFRAGIPAPAGRFRILTGKPREYVKVADSARGASMLSALRAARLSILRRA
ncbi:MAG TPA: GFA family protein [Burkholderiales bacterium]|nr:GFA family protein [Burkholderiales bacterium]